MLGRWVAALAALGLGGPRDTAAQEAGVFAPGLGVVARRLVPRHQTLGPQELRDVNVSAAVFSVADAAEACAAMQWDSPGGVARGADAVLERHAGQVVLLLNAEYAKVSECALFLPGTYLLAELLCRYVSPRLVIVLPRPGRRHGAWSSYTSSGFAQLPECAVFESIATDATAALVSAAHDPSWTVDLLSEPNEYLVMFRVWSTFFKYVTCALCLCVAVQAIATIVERKRRAVEHEHPSFLLVLVWNIWIMVALAVFSYVDGWGITTNPATFQIRNLYQTCFFGQGAALNLLLAQLWSTVLGHSRTSRPLCFSLGPFLLVVLFDTISTICLAFRFGGFFFSSTVMPGCLVLLELVVSLRLLYLSRTLLITIRDARNTIRNERLADRMHNLHINIAYSAAVSAIGSLLTVASLAAYSLGFAWDSPSRLVALGLTGYVARCSTAVAQIRFCWPAGSRPSRSAVAPKPGTVSAAAALKQSPIPSAASLASSK
jgi:hypothetical protein